MQSSFKNQDVTLLLKDITGRVEPLPSDVRERLIQSGRHYSEMLPLEYRPTKKYLEIYERSLKDFGQDTADAVAVLSAMLISHKGKDMVLVSLARAGIPAGILIKDYIKQKYGFDIPHYAISIIRGKGIDKNAMKFLLNRYSLENLQFVDGWTGKGAISRELTKAVADFPGVSDSLAVIADPAGITDLCGTHEDILIPSSCLNSTVSGLISRTFLRDDVIGPGDFHGAAFYGELKDEDRTYEFIDKIESMFRPDAPHPTEKPMTANGMEIVRAISQKYGISDISLIKPGIGETTRVLLRRVPWKILIHKDHKDDAALSMIRQLAHEKNVPIEYDSLGNYRCCGLIKEMADT